MTDVYFQGQKLPPLREGKVWSMRIWPGGRLEVKQVNPHEIVQTATAAIRKLERGQYAYVWLDDSAYVAQQWKNYKTQR